MSHHCSHSHKTDGCSLEHFVKNKESTQEDEGKEPEAVPAETDATADQNIGMTAIGCCSEKKKDDWKTRLQNLLVERHEEVLIIQQLYHDSVYQRRPPQQPQHLSMSTDDAGNLTETSCVTSHTTRKNRSNSCKNKKKPSNFLLVTGPLGVGKTHLVVQSLRRQLQQGCDEEQNVTLIRGKFDFLQRLEPYSAFVAAFTDFAHQTLARNDKNLLQTIRERFYQRALFSSPSCMVSLTKPLPLPRQQQLQSQAARILCSMIPALEMIFLPPPPLEDWETGTTSTSTSGSVVQADASDTVESASPNEESSSHSIQQRFVFLFRTFITAVCSSRRQEPLVLMLDDLQYADPCSVDLLGHILMDDENRDGLFVVGTLDSEQSHNGEAKYLTLKLRDLEQKGHVSVTRVALQNLSLDAVTDIITETFLVNNDKDNNNAQDEKNYQNRQAYASLGRIVYTYTQGNPFQVCQFLCSLVEDWDLVYREKDGSWQWDDDDIGMSMDGLLLQQGRQRPMDSGFLVAAKLARLDKDDQEVLKIASCMGSVIDQEMIGLVLASNNHQIQKGLETASDHGLVVVRNSSGCWNDNGQNASLTVRYEFAHDLVQQAAYRLVSDDDKDLVHLEIGGRIWRALDEETLERKTFTILSHVILGQSRITKAEEKQAVAPLCLHAGRKAASMSSFRIAAAYLKFGISLLELRSWRDHYDLSLALHNAAAEMELCTTNFERMNDIIQKIFQHAHSFHDKIPAHRARLYALSIADRGPEAIQKGLEVLEELGERLPRHFQRFHLMRMFWKLQKVLQTKSDEEILQMPKMVDENALHRTLFLLHITLQCLLTRSDLGPMVLMKILNITLDHGLSVFAPVAFAGFGVFYITATKDFEGGFRFGQLALMLQEKCGSIEYIPRVNSMVHGIIYSWKRPLTETLAPLERAYHIGFQTGDIEMANVCANLRTYHNFYVGRPLDECLAHYDGHQRILVSTRQEFLKAMSYIRVQAFQHFMGLSPDPLAAKGPLMDYDTAAEQALQAKAIPRLVLIKLARLHLAYVFNDIDLAAKYVSIVDMAWKILPTFDVVRIYFFGGMTFLGLALHGRNVRTNIRKCKKALKSLESFAKACPENCLDSLLLLQAELASVEHENKKAREYFVSSIAAAQANGFLTTQALANERAARHYIRLGDKPSAAPFFEHACYLYREWGAHAKADRLEAEVAELYLAKVRPESMEQPKLSESFDNER